MSSDREGERVDLGRCLLFVHSLPWPPQGGQSLRDWQNVSILSARATLAVVALEGVPGERPPHKEIELWTTLDAELLEEPAPFDGSEVVLESEWWRNELGYPSDECWSPFRAAALRRLLRRTSFDLAIVDDIVFWRYAEIVRDFVPLVIDYQNVQSQYDAEYLAFLPEEDVGERERAAMALRTMRRVEERFRQTPTVVCSESDKAGLVDRGFAADNIAVVHNTVDIDEEDSTELHAPPVPRVLFSGMMNYPPNASAALELIADIFPRVRSLVPDAELWIVGMDPEPALLRAARSAPGVMVTGRVRATRPYFRSSSVMSVPLTLGGGTKYKILEAFKYRLPVVGSPKGCEGLDVVDGRDLLVARSADEHAGALVRILRDRDLGARLAASAEQLLRSRYSFAVATRQWDEALRRFAPALRFRPGG